MSAVLPILDYTLLRNARNPASTDERGEVAFVDTLVEDGWRI